MYTFNNIINEIKRQTTRQKKIKKKKIVVLSTITQEDKGGFTSTFTKQQPEELSAKIKEKFFKKKNKN